jgi:hypothetical protein
MPRLPKEALRPVTTLMLIACVAAAGACGTSSKKGEKTDAGHDAAAGARGADAGDASDASDASAGHGGSDASVDTAGDTTGDARDAAGDVALEAPPPIDAGADCVPPTGEAALSPVTEGVPAAGLALWLRGDRGVYKTAAQGVCAWADQSGGDRVLTGTGLRPTWEATGLGGKAAVHFTAAGQQLGIGNVLGLAATSARTIVAVQILGGLGQRFESVTQGQNGTPGTYLGLDENTFNTVGNREGVYMMNNAYDAALATSAAPRIHVYTIQTMTPGAAILGNIDYRVNGATQTLTRTPDGLGNGNFEDFSGADFTSVGSNAEGVIAEVLVYNRALSVDERAALEASLEARYGITP